MSPRFNEQFSANNRDIFKRVRMPTLEVGPDAPVAHPQSFLSSAGIHSLRQLIDRREHHDPIELGKIDDDGKFSPFRARLECIVSDFFLGESVYLERNTGHEHLARRPQQHFDVREIARCTYTPTGDTAHIFCCRYGETAEAGINLQSTTAVDEYLEKLLHPASIQLAIPSRAGLLPPDAVSLVHPLRMFPREYVKLGEAGAVVACTESRPGYVADLYWSKEAFVDSLNRVQEIGRHLIHTDAVARATMRRTGEIELPIPSAIFAKIYEETARFAQSLEPSLFITGVWGVAIFPGDNGTYTTQIGVVGLEIEEEIQGTGNTIATGKNECFGVLSQTLSRDAVGFLSIEPGRFSRLPVADLAWYERLPEL